MTDLPEMAPGLVADVFIETPEFQQTRGGRTVQAPDRWVVPMFRQKGELQVRDGRWYQQRHNWETEMIPSDIDAGASDSRPPTAEPTPVQSEEEDSGSAWWGEDRQKREAPGEASFHSRWHSF